MSGRTSRTRPALAVVAVLLALAAGCTTPTISLVNEAAPECEPGRRLAVVAQAVPSASLVPCIADLDSPWRFLSLDVERGRARLSLVYLDPNERSARVELTEDCDTGGAETSAASPQSGVTEFERPTLISTRIAGTRYEVFEGGCVTTTYDLPRDTGGLESGAERLIELTETVELFPRAELSRELEEDLDLELGLAGRPGSSARSDR